MTANEATLSGGGGLLYSHPIPRGMLAAAGRGELWTGRITVDASLLATDAVALLAPYIARAGNRAADDLGDGAASSVRRLYAAVRDRIKATPGADVLDHLSGGVKDVYHLDALRGILAEAIEKDPEFLSALAPLVAEASADSSAGRGASDSHGSVQRGERNVTGDHAGIDQRRGNFITATNVDIRGDVIAGRRRNKKAGQGR